MFASLALTNLCISSGVPSGASGCMCISFACRRYAVSVVEWIVSMVTYVMSATIAHSVRCNREEREAMADRISRTVTQPLHYDGWTDSAVPVVLSRSSASAGCQLLTRSAGLPYDLKVSAAIYRLTHAFLCLVISA